MTRMERPLLRYHGGKWLLAPWIIEHFPPHRIYVEPFGGGASVLLRKERAYAEIYNDLDGEIVNLFQVVRDRGAELLRAVELTPYARTEFELSVQACADPIEQARRTLVRSYMGFGGNVTRLTKSGRLEHTGFRDYSKKNRRSIPAHDWRTWPEGLPDLIDRLRGVVIEHQPALDLMPKHDGPETLYFVDPPYPHETRGRSCGYRHELTTEDHLELAQALKALSGMVLISGYDCKLYRDAFAGWECLQRRAFADGAKVRTECLWLNGAAQAFNKRLL